MTMTNQAPFGQLVVHGTYTAFGQLVVYGTYKSYWDVKLAFALYSYMIKNFSYVCYQNYYLNNIFTKNNQPFFLS